MLVAFSVGLALILSLVAPFGLKPLLQRMSVIDIPNERSSHSRPVIRGGGLAPLVAVVGGFAVVLFAESDLRDATLLMVVAAVALASGMLGWLEDSRRLSVATRAGVQLVIGFAGAGVAVALAGSFWWLVPILGVGVAGYINVANFMDGINGISGLHGAIAGATFALIGFLWDVPLLIPAGLIIAVAFLGFLPWNLIRGGMFLGDTGSYLLGGSIAIVAVVAVAQDVPVIVVVGPLAIYLADTGSTLIRRVIRGERWHEAHRSHVYQRLIDYGFSHLQVTLLVALATALSSGFGMFGVLDIPGGAWASGLLVLLVATLYLMLPMMLVSRRGFTEDTRTLLEPIASNLPGFAVPHVARTWAVLGASGFIGSALSSELKARGFGVLEVPAPRLDLFAEATTSDILSELSRRQGAVDILSGSLAGIDVVVNAAGVATPDSAAGESLYGANALLPSLIAKAAAAAGVARVVHLSSAAVQGRRSILDETLSVAPFSPYSKSKALGEAGLLKYVSQSSDVDSPEVVIVRATSVQGVGRATTRQLGRLARSPFASVAGDGNQPTVVSSLKGLVEFVAEVGAYEQSVPTIVLQPWEGMTTSMVLEMAGRRAPRRLPLALCRLMIKLGYAAGSIASPLNGVVRRVELMWVGQQQDAAWARSVGLEGHSYVVEVFAHSVTDAQ